MPHIAITMLPGRTPEQKKSLARRLRDVLSDELKIDNLQVSVSIEDLPMEGWSKFLSDLPQESIMIPEERRNDLNSNTSNCRCS